MTFGFGTAAIVKVIAFFPLLLESLLCVSRLLVVRARDQQRLALGIDWDLKVAPVESLSILAGNLSIRFPAAVEFHFLPPIFHIE